MASVSHTVNIVKVLYQFDEPILFVAKVGMFLSLFLKTDETDYGHEFLSCYIDDPHVEGLLDGRISIRGVFEAQKDNFIVVTDDSYNVLDERRAAAEEINEGRLPKANKGVFPRFGECPDVLLEKNTFLSIYFRGSGLNREFIPYSTLMSLLGSVQSLARNVITPPELRGLRSSTLDFLVGDPALGSLMISIKEPTFSLGKLRQSPNRRDITRDAVNIGVNRYKDEFLLGMEELIDNPHKARLNGDTDEEVLFNNVRQLLPSDTTPYTSVTFASQRGDSFKRISISKERADAVRAVHESRNANTGQRSGTIVEINAASHTLLLRSRTGVVTTCAFDRALFDRLRKDTNFKIGSKAQVNGDVYERIRRDYLVVRSVPTITPA